MPNDKNNPMDDNDLYGDDADYAIDDGVDDATYDDADYDDAAEIAGTPAAERSFFQRYSSLIIFGTIGLVMLGVGFLTFKDTIFPAKNGALPPAAEQTATQDQNAGLPPQSDQAVPAPQDPNQFTDPATAPALATGNPSDTGTPQNGAGSAAMAPAPMMDPTAPMPPAAPDMSNAQMPVTQPNAPALADNNALPPAAPAQPAASATTAPAAAPAAANNSAQLQALQQTNADQQQIIDNLQEQLALAQSALSNAQDELKSKPAAPAKAAKSSTDNNDNNTVTSDSDKPAAKKAAKKTVPSSSAANTTRSARYELRSVSGDAAWVAPSGSSEMRRVQVGDSLPGIGKVTAIKEQNGNWIVQGTSGRIQ